MRDYQHAAEDSIFAYFEEGNTGNPLVAMPTGVGKTRVFCEFIRHVYTLYPNQRIMKLTHVKELISQNFNTLLHLWPSAPAGIFSSGLKRRETRFPITFGGIASVVRCPERFGHIDLVIIDEAHLVSPNQDTMYQKFILALRNVNPYLKVIGFTATKYRMGQGLLTEEDGLFTDICMDMTGMDSFNWFIDQGYLVPLVPRKTNYELNVDDVRTQGGEFVQKDLQAAVDRDEITYAILLEAMNLAPDREHIVIFCSGIEHSVHVRDMLEKLGVEAGCVHSKMADKERDQNIADFKNGKYRVITNNGILTTGFDFPAIDCEVILRPTNSPGLWVQILGRSTRPVYAPGYDLEQQAGRLAAIKASPKKNALILDFAGNTRRLGPINDPRLPRRKGSGGGEAPVKVCPVCNTYNHAAVRICTNCGYEFPKDVKISTGASVEDLVRKSTPQVEWFKVDHVTYNTHSKQDRPASIRVCYFCGLRRFEEWVCLSHAGYARKKARDWWRLHTTHPEEPVPESTEEGHYRLRELRTPEKIRVWVNTDFPQVMNYGFRTEEQVG